MPDADRPEATPRVTPAGYDGAVDHYTSSDRRDAVKRTWEEPATRRVIDTALGHLPPTSELRVLDIGCGTGEGLALLRSTPTWRRRSGTGTTLRYVGLDLDERLLEVARGLHGDDDGVTFVHGDVREGLPADDADLYLSSGVPFSHLTTGELERALTGILRAARRRPHPVAVVVDVLGRYSVEWTSRWAQRRWDYRMSFFRSDHRADSTDMTCYGGAELRAALWGAAGRAECPLSGVECSDRSVLVGRHTTTGEYTPGIRPYRELVNALHDPLAEVDLDQLRFDIRLPDAPGEILGFYAGFGAAWNALLEETRQAVRRVADPGIVAADLQPRLASRLRDLEAASQRGLGVGHSLTAVAVTRPAGTHPAAAS
jgi:SAM-dependent methyltransferase